MPAWDFSCPMRPLCSCQQARFGWDCYFGHWWTDICHCQHLGWFWNLPRGCDRRCCKHWSEASVVCWLGVFWLNTSGRAGSYGWLTFSFRGDSILISMVSYDNLYKSTISAFINHECSLLSTLSPALVSCFPHARSPATLTGMRWDCISALICVSLKISALELFSHT